MIRTLYWHRIPSHTTLSALPKLHWARNGDLSAASSTVALMLYVALHFMAEDVLEDNPLDGGFLTEAYGEKGAELQPTGRIASVSYDDLAHALGGTSRSLIAQGLQRLEQLNLITRMGSHQKRRYRLAFPPNGWFKLPCQAVVRSGVIEPFKNFTLRSSHELHALKVYLYLAARRDNAKTFTVASYEKISAGTGVQERHLRKALVTLTVCNLLADINRERDPKGVTAAFGPNIYYLRGWGQLFQSSNGTSVTPETAPAAAPTASTTFADLVEDPF